ncbi:MAG: hypothetical protein WAQ25_00675 [Candidatus Saccharimonas sp.]
MEPKQFAQPGGIERAPAPTSIFEQPGMAVERGVGYNPEAQQVAPQEIGAAQAEASQIAMPALPAPVAQQVDDSTMQPSSSTPLVAGDDDLIEKEWVDKAKKILAETKDDPHRRETEISKLQVEYIRKRYGREIGAASD